jgi:hypothetical protein
MPLIKPKDKETREDFISRCMADDKTTSEFPATDQRLAVCNTQYKNNKKKEKYSMNDIEKMGEAIKSLTDVISSKAKQATDSQDGYFKAEEDGFDREACCRSKSRRNRLRRNSYDD